MKTIKKQLLKIMLCAITLSALQPAHVAHAESIISDKVLGLSFVSAALGFAVMNEELADSDTFRKGAEFIDIDPDDLAPCVVFSLGLAALSCIPDGAGRIVLRVGAVLPILAAACLPKKALHKLAQLPGIRHYFEFMKDAKGLPLIGDYAQCNQLGCKGLCHKCKARKLFLTVPLAAIPFIPTIYRSFKGTVARWERERVEQINYAKIERERRREQQRDENLRREHRLHYEALNIPFDAVLTDEMVREKFADAMRAAHTDKGNEAAGAAEKIDRIRIARDALREHLRRNNPPEPAPAPAPAPQPVPEPQEQPQATEQEVITEPEFVPLPSDDID